VEVAHYTKWSLLLSVVDVNSILRGDSVHYPVWQAKGWGRSR